MLRNHIKIALRALWKQKLSALINIFGLSVGIACAAVAMAFVRHEYSYDRFHDESDHIYWLTAKLANGVNLSATPGPLAPELKEHFPQVTESLRLESQEIIVRSGRDLISETGLFVEDNFFDFFDFKLLRGDEQTALSQINTVVLSEPAARRYFGRVNPLGQPISIYFQGEETAYTVAGVAAPAPTNSSFEFDFLLPIRQAYRSAPEDLENEWASFPVTSFIRLREASDAPALEEPLLSLITDRLTAATGEDDPNVSFEMHAFKDYHLKSGLSANGLKDSAEKSYVDIMAVIALLILLIACLNFTNLSNAMGSGRLTEVGVRQVLGAGKRQLTTQFLVEAVVTSFIALGAAIILIELFLPAASPLFGFKLDLVWTSPATLLPLLFIALLAGLLAGVYPALLLAKLKTVETFKSNFKIGGNNLVTKGSLVFQFILSVGLLSCTFVIWQQQQFISNRNLGFDQEEVVVVSTHTRYFDTTSTQQLVDQFRDQCSGISGIAGMTATSSSFNRGNQARFIPEEDGSQTFVFEYTVEPNYLELLGIELQEGRPFNTDRTPDNNRSIIVNEAFIRQYEVSAIDAFQLPEKFGDLANHRIIGVTGDYHYNHLRSEVAPMFLHMQEEPKFRFILVKVQPDNIQQTLANMKDAWSKVSPDKPFEYSFLDEDIQQQYEAEERWSKVVSGAAILAILIALLGVFGLVSLSLVQRTKEIGIRKVLGASVGQIVGLFGADFMKLMVIATVIATPLAFLLMKKWLQDYSYRIDIHWWVFALAGAAAIVLALTTIGFRSLQAARANPVDALRNE